MFTLVSRVRVSSTYSLIGSKGTVSDANVVVGRGSEWTPVHSPRVYWSISSSLFLVQTQFLPDRIIHPCSTFTYRRYNVRVSPFRNFLSPFPFRGVALLETLTWISSEAYLPHTGSQSCMYQSTRHYHRTDPQTLGFSFSFVYLSTYLHPSSIV